MTDTSVLSQVFDIMDRVYHHQNLASKLKILIRKEIDGEFYAATLHPLVRDLQTLQDTIVHATGCLCQLQNEGVMQVALAIYLLNPDDKVKGVKTLRTVVKEMDLSLRDGKQLWEAAQLLSKAAISEVLESASDIMVSHFDDRTD